jgi:periplasmic divalent cation tolerance protein
MVEKIESLFWWQGKVDRAKEALLIIKSKKTKFPKIIKLVKSLHSYEVSEIIALPILGGNQEYLRWLDDSLR